MTAIDHEMPERTDEEAPAVEVPAITAGDPKSRRENIEADGATRLFANGERTPFTARFVSVIEDREHRKARWELYVDGREDPIATAPSRRNLMRDNGRVIAGLDPVPAPMTLESEEAHPTVHETAEESIPFAELVERHVAPEAPVAAEEPVEPAVETAREGIVAEATPEKVSDPVDAPPVEEKVVDPVEEKSTEPVDAPPIEK